MSLLMRQCFCEEMKMKIKTKSSKPLAFFLLLLFLKIFCRFKPRNDIVIETKYIHAFTDRHLKDHVFAISPIQVHKAQRTLQILENAQKTTKILEGLFRQGVASALNNSQG